MGKYIFKLYFFYYGFVFWHYLNCSPNPNICVTVHITGHLMRNHFNVRIMGGSHAAFYFRWYWKRQGRDHKQLAIVSHVCAVFMSMWHSVIPWFKSVTFSITCTHHRRNCVDDSPYFSARLSCCSCTRGRFLMSHSFPWQPHCSACVTRHVTDGQHVLRVTDETKAENCSFSLKYANKGIIILTK